MHIHILGICGTFMGSLAVLAKELGHRVTGSDANVYPPMGTQLEGASSWPGLRAEPARAGAGSGGDRQCPQSRQPGGGIRAEQGLPYVSGPQWLADHVLQGRWVLAAGGTHSKTTTGSMLAWVLEHAGMSPGFLHQVACRRTSGISARLGGTPFFVVEADEYDSASSTSAASSSTTARAPRSSTTRIRSRGHLSGSRRYRAAGFIIWYARCRARTDHPSRVGRCAQARHRHGLLDPCADHR